MKSIITLLLFTIISFMGLSQDVIVKRDGGKIQAKVIEITNTTIKYKKFEQEDGPLRNIKISEVSEIIYDNGDWEKFKKEDVKEEEGESNPRPTRPSQSKRDPLFNSGMYLDLMLGGGFIERTNPDQSIYYYDENGNFVPEGILPEPFETANPISLSFRIGHKWMFGQSSTYRPGLQVQWMKIGVNLNPDQGYASYSLSPLNVGITNAIRFNDKHGMEINATGGFSAVNLNPFSLIGGGGIGGSDGDFGYTFGAELKYRFNILAIGLDYSRINAGFNSTNYRHNLNIFSVTAGIKL